MTEVLNELDVLSTCALRIDGYAWATWQGIDREQLMKPFWHEEARDELFAESWDYQWAAWFMQERSFRWSGATPSNDAIALWRRLFLALADKRPSPPFDRGGPDGDPTAVQQWDQQFAPRVRSLKDAIAGRLQHETPAAEPLALEE